MARILGVDLPRNKAMKIALRYVYGIGPKIAVDVLNKANISLEKNSNDLTEEEVTSIRNTIKLIRRLLIILKRRRCAQNQSLQTKPY